MELIKKADERKMKWRVRYALGETLCHFMKYVSSQTQKEILNIYLDFLTDKEQEIRSISVNALPKLCGEI